MSTQQSVLPFVASIQEQRFNEFHARHPEVYARLLEMARALRRAGRTHYGIRGLWETMRYNFALAKDPGEKYKLQDHHTRFYSRLQMANHPELAGMFETRERKGKAA